MNVVRPNNVTPPLRELWRNAVKRLRAHRGGAELYVTIGGETAPDELLDQLVSTGAVWTIGGNELAGFAVVRNDIVEAIFVSPDARRQRVATSLLEALISSAAPPRDGFALPGDRGTKSLYESLGWKARLLTMRGE